MKKQKQYKIMYFSLIFLTILSIISGYIFSDIFLGLSSDFFSKDVFINPGHYNLYLEKLCNTLYIKVYPLFFSLFFFLLFDDINWHFKKVKLIYFFFKLKIYFDFIINLFVLHIYKYSYLFFFKILDKIILEYLGSFGLSRFFFFISFFFFKYNSKYLFSSISFFLFFFLFLLIF